MRKCVTSRVTLYRTMKFGALRTRSKNDAAKKTLPRLGTLRYSSPSTPFTNAFSKKPENLKAACALHFAYYNRCRIHQTLRVTPCMEAGVTDHQWSIAELLGATQC